MFVFQKGTYIDEYFQKFPPQMYHIQNNSTKN